MICKKITYQLSAVGFVKIEQDAVVLNPHTYICFQCLINVAFIHSKSPRKKTLPTHSYRLDISSAFPNPVLISFVIQKTPSMSCEFVPHNMNTHIISICESIQKRMISLKRQCINDSCWYYVDIFVKYNDFISEYIDSKTPEFNKYLTEIIQENNSIDTIFTISTPNDLYRISYISREIERFIKRGDVIYKIDNVYGTVDDLNVKLLCTPKKLIKLDIYRNNKAIIVNVILDNNGALEDIRAKYEKKKSTTTTDREKKVTEIGSLENTESKINEEIQHLHKQIKTYEGSTILMQNEVEKLKVINDEVLARKDEEIRKLKSTQAIELETGEAIYVNKPTEELEKLKQQYEQKIQILEENVAKAIEEKDKAIAGIDNAKSESEQEKQNLQQKITESQGENTRMHQEYNTQIEELQQSKQQYEQTIKTLKANMATSNEENQKVIASIQNSKSGFNEEIQRLYKQITECNKTNTSMHQEYDTQIEGLEKSKHQYEQKIQTLEENVAKAIEEKDKAIAGIENAKSESEQEKQKLQQKIAESHGENTSMHQEYNTQIQELEKLKQQYEQKIQTLEENVAVEKASWTDLNNHTTILHTQLATLTSMYDELLQGQDAEISNLKSAQAIELETGKATGENELTNEYTKKLQQEILTLKEQCSSLRTENNSLTKTLTDAKTTNLDMTIHEVEVQQKMHNITAEKNTLQQQCTSIQQENSTLRQKLAVVEAQIVAMTNLNADLQQNIQSSVTETDTRIKQLTDENGLEQKKIEQHAISLQSLLDKTRIELGEQQKKVQDMQTQQGTEEFRDQSLGKRERNITDAQVHELTPTLQQPEESPEAADVYASLDIGFLESTPEHFQNDIDLYSAELQTPTHNDSEQEITPNVNSTGTHDNITLNFKDPRSVIKTIVEEVVKGAEPGTYNTLSLESQYQDTQTLNVDTYWDNFKSFCKSKKSVYSEYSNTGVQHCKMNWWIALIYIIDTIADKELEESRFLRFSPFEFAENINLEKITDVTKHALNEDKYEIFKFHNVNAHWFWYLLLIENYIHQDTPNTGNKSLLTKVQTINKTKGKFAQTFAKNLSWFSVNDTTNNLACCAYWSQLKTMFACMKIGKQPRKLTFLRNNIVVNDKNIKIITEAGMYAFLGIPKTTEGCGSYILSANELAENVSRTFLQKKKH